MTLILPDSILHALKANAPLMTLVAPGSIYSSYVPKSVLATTVWIAYERVSGGEESAHSGDQGLTHPRYQFTIGGTDKTVIDSVRDILVKFNGYEYTDPNGNVLTFFHADDNESHDYDTRVYSTTVDLFVWVNN